ncbi:Putative zinc binding domain-containing protein [Bradyrhizobium lablabi]|uniref:Putative zinc binding domain-containing protein n=1 Tax=Bradyrhizobium lablabi TaxID=722472 RepID=A0A1M7BDR4_9BRAD|nr:class I SAM-dependent methyltransferase [Bradyrhizobium lablabi]SHL53064.1 Putative zinc binding domain-containing protein [Bradyrhizobium lablabi]
MAEQASAITSCEVCGSVDLRLAVDLGFHPMCDDLVAVGDDRACREYPIEILFCDVCRTAHQRFQIPKHELFPATYHYRSRHTADVLNGMKDLVAACEQSLGSLAAKKVLDIGCNDGSLLSFFVAKGAIAFGIEPTGAAADASQRGYPIVNDFFSEAVAEDFVRRHGRPDIVTFTNVFAHIEDLKSVLRALQQVCQEHTLIVIENHYLGAILDKNQFDTFYHEHPRTYSYTSFAHIAKSLGREIVRAEFPKRYGGNIRIFLAAPHGPSRADDGQAAIARAEELFGQRLDQLAGKISRWKTNKLDEIRSLVAEHGPMRAKAFPGRAAIPIKMLGLTTADVSAAYEKPGSAKIGHYIPGTRIPIKSDDDFDPGKADQAPLLNLAWHITNEISSYLRQRGYAGRIIDIISPEDFLDKR